MRVIRSLLLASVFVLVSGCASVVTEPAYLLGSWANGARTEVPEGEFIPGKPNIILVHGFTNSPGSMLPMKERMENAGWNVLIPDIGSSFSRVEEMASKLVDFIRKKESAATMKHGSTLESLRDDVLLFGHSQGGLVVVTAQRLDRELIRLPVTTAGTVFKGTPMALFAVLTETGRNKLPGSAWLLELEEDMRAHPRDLLQITAETDWLIPASANVLPNYPVYVAPFSGHMALIYELDPAILGRRLPKHFPPR